jgi:CBS domain containing-hemolysin-like protein
VIDLPLTRITDARLAVPGMDPWHVNPTDPALSVMTDFREHASITVSERTAIDEALEHMRHTGVRSAFVTDELTQLSGIPRHGIVVADIMQPVAAWRVVNVADLEKTHVAAVADLFARSGLTHVPVVETTAAGGQRLRGLLSAARVKRVLHAAQEVSVLA